MKADKRPFLVRGADGNTIEIADSEYYINVKARARRMMLNSLSPESRRVYACLELATMGYQQELAVTMANGKKRPLTRSDIHQQTGLAEAHVRRALVELEEQGLAERRGVDGGPLYKGRVEIYCWAEPRTPKIKNGSQRAAPIPAWFPDSWKPLKTLITRLKLALPPDLGDARDSLFAEGEEVARGFEEAEKGAKEFINRVCARSKSMAHIRNERNERNSERKGSSSAVSSKGIGKAEEDSATLYQAFKTNYPADHFDEPKAKPSFESKTKAERRRIIERLAVYLDCERWKDEDGKWIPFASKWLESYEADPPPAFKRRTTKSATRDALDTFAAGGGGE